ncbi:hypothetical protein KJ891_04375, partial [Candidatus Micrarchaeota archaeon]|nr:hypothetical protein [Candidatus Micrarchaeota archaeon]
LLFKNGKLICAGAKREAFLRKGLKKAAELIKSVNQEGMPKPAKKAAGGKAKAGAKKATAEKKPAAKKTAKKGKK